MIKIIFSLLTVLFIGTSFYVGASTIETKDWTSISSFTTPQSSSSSLLSNNTWYVSQVDSDVWSKSLKSDYSDIRIINSANEEIPYIIVKQGQTAKTESVSKNANSQVKIIENTIQSNKGVSDRVLVLDTGKEGQVYTGIIFNTVKSSINFRKIVNVYISDTLLGANSPAWREVEQKGLIYNYTDPSGFSIENTEITFPNMASRYIKIRFENDQNLIDKGVSFSNQVAISEAQIKYEERNVTTGVKIENYLSGDFIFSKNDLNSTSISIEKILQNQEKKSTEIYVRDVKALTSITLKINEKSTNFNRNISIQGSNDSISWQTVTTGQIHRIYSPIYKGDMLNIMTPVLTYPYLRIVIQNQNNTPLIVEDTINITTQKIGVLFKADNIDVNSLKFLIGNKNIPAPTYEIEKTLAYFNNIVPTEVFLTKTDNNPAFQEGDIHVPFGQQYKNIVNGALVLFVVLLGYIGYSWTKRV